MSEQVWTILNKFGQVLKSYDESGQVWIDSDNSRSFWKKSGKNIDPSE